MHLIYIMLRIQVFSTIGITNYLSLVNENNGSVWTTYYLSKFLKYIKDDFIPKSLFKLVST